MVGRILANLRSKGKMYRMTNHLSHRLSCQLQRHQERHCRWPWWIDRTLRELVEDVDQREWIGERSWESDGRVAGRNVGPDPQNSKSPTTRTPLWAEWQLYPYPPCVRSLGVFLTRLIQLRNSLAPRFTLVWTSASLYGNSRGRGKLPSTPSRPDSPHRP